MLRWSNKWWRSHSPVTQRFCCNISIGHTSLKDGKTLSSSLKLAKSSAGFVSSRERRWTVITDGEGGEKSSLTAAAEAGFYLLNRGRSSLTQALPGCCCADAGGQREAQARRRRGPAQGSRRGRTARRTGVRPSPSSRVHAGAIFWKPALPEGSGPRRTSSYQERQHGAHVWVS